MKLKTTVTLMLGLMIVLLSFKISATDFEQYGWTSAEIDAANTATTVSYLQNNEKEVMLVMNLCRLYPDRFLNLMKDMWAGETTNSYAYETDVNSSYFKSLLADLKKQTPLSALIPGENLSETAKKHAKDMGNSGKTGHKSSNGKDFGKRMEKYLNQYLMVGENCSYGYDNAVDIVMQLLVDNTVKSLGHRKNILSKDFNTAGISIFPHKTYQYNCVIDYSGKP